MTERLYQMTRIYAGDYLLPSNDRLTLWRISRYYEDGSLEQGGKPLVGWFWRAARHRDPFDRIAPHVIGALYGDVPSNDAVERFLDWDSWLEHACLLPTRDAAIAAALDQP
jgi:hypothetical protein